MDAAWRSVSMPVAGGLEAVQLHARVVEEGVEDADRVGSAADAGRDGIREARRSARAPAARASSPMIFWKSRTMAGNGCGPAAVPKM